jgi:hypothetical protein
METIMDNILNYLNVFYLLTFVFLGYLVKRYFQGLLKKWFKKEIKLVYVVLILAAIVAIPYLLTGAEWQKILFTYTFGTSLHEVFFARIEEKFKSKSQ